MPGAGEKNKSAYQHFVHVTAHAISCHIYSLVICSKRAAILLLVCFFIYFTAHSHIDRNREIRALDQDEHLPSKMPTSDRTVGPTNMCALAEPIWRRVPSAGPVCWVSWRSCGGGSVWRTRIWPSRCPSEETFPPCCNSRTTARCVPSPQATSLPRFTRFITPSPPSLLVLHFVKNNVWTCFFPRRICSLCCFMENILAMNNLEGKLIPENVVFLQCFLLRIYFPRKGRKMSVCNKKYGSKGCKGNADSEHLWLFNYHSITAEWFTLTYFSTDSKPQNQVNTVVIAVFCVFLG